MTLNIDDIFKAWLKTAIHSDEEKELAMARLEVCNSCPNKKKGLGSMNICGICSCPISINDTPVGKTYTKVNDCPEKRWEK